MQGLALDIEDLRKQLGIRDNTIERKINEVAIKLAGEIRDIQDRLASNTEDLKLSI